VGGQRHAPAALPQGKTRYPLYRGLGGPQGRSGRVRKISLPTGIRSPDGPARSESMYRLSYPGPQEEKYNASLFEKCCDIMTDTVMYIHCCFEIPPVECELFSERISKGSKCSISRCILLENERLASHSRRFTRTERTQVALE
jgi:hypothetical protein